MGKRATVNVISVLFLSILVTLAIQFFPSMLVHENSFSQKPSKNWVPLQKNSLPSAPQVKVLKSDGKSCVLSLETYGFYEETAEVGGMDFQKLLLPCHGFSDEPGKPMLPIVTGFVEIPEGKKAKALAIVLESKSLHGYDIYPCQDLAFGCDCERNEGEFRFAKAFYAADTCYPDILVSVDAPIHLRDYTLVQLSIYPIRYNPAARRLDVATRMKVELSYYDAEETCISSSDRFRSAVFDKVCRPFIWNYECRPKVFAEQSEGYLIISHDDFYSAMGQFADWKRSKGLNVTSKRLSDIAENATDVDIYNYIRHAFYNWASPPTYILLVGDVEYLPTHYVNHTFKLGFLATDNYYACVHGEDCFPDLFVGRLSVKNVTELNNTLDKIMSYDGLINANVTLVVDNHDFFNWCADWIYDFLTSEGYAVDMIVDKDWSNATRDDIAKAVNEGRAILNYNGEGLETKWLASSFSNEDVYTLLNNTGKYPIVLSFTCETGKYDFNDSDCLGEAWMKAPEKGAVAFWGSSSTADAQPGIELYRGFYEAMLNHELCEFGPMTVQAKLYMLNVMKSSKTAPIHVDLFNILTDPQLILRKPRTCPVYIRADGSVEGTDKIRCDGDIYTLTGDINGSIVVERNNTIVEGDDHALQGNGTGTGIFLFGINNVTIKNVNIKGFAKGIFLDSTSEASVFRNNITESYFGILLTHCTNNSIYSNNITRNQYGIALADIGSKNNFIFGNDISQNDHGITTKRAYSNSFYHNNFVNNSHQAEDIGSTNTWDRGCLLCGNYWSDYNGTDDFSGLAQTSPGGDGIGEKPYQIPQYSLDRYPLMSPISIFHVGTFSGKPCWVDIISNSTISNFQIDVQNKIISFNVTGEIGSGFCRIVLPNTLIEDMWGGNYTILVDGKALLDVKNWTYDAHTALFFAYQHSEHNIIIIPEFPSSLILPLIMITALLSVVACKQTESHKIFAR